MDREELARMLAEGLSHAEIGRRVDRAPATVVYWIDKHGLERQTSINRTRGGLPRDVLEALVARGLTIREIASETGRSMGTVSHWLKRYGLVTAAAAGKIRDGAEGKRRHGWCSKHGDVVFVGRSDGGWGCGKCRSEAVVEWRRRTKAQLVAEAGGACVVCGYSRHVAALHFHHVRPEDKRFGIGSRGLARSIEDLRVEAAKCVLLCSNCHAEVEAGATVLPPAAIKCLPPGPG